MEHLVEEHNKMVANGITKYADLRDIEIKILKGFKELDKEDTITYYDQMVDSMVKFDLFLQIKKQWMQK